MSSFRFLLQVRELRWSAKTIEAGSFRLPMEEHDEKFPVRFLYHPGLEIHCIAGPFLFSSLASGLGIHYVPQEKVNGSPQHRFHQSLVSLLDYADAGDYVLSFTATAKVNQRGEVLARVFVFLAAVDGGDERSERRYMSKPDTSSIFIQSLRNPTTKTL